MKSNPVCISIKFNKNSEMNYTIINGKLLQKKSCNMMDSLIVEDFGKLGHNQCLVMANGKTKSFTFILNSVSKNSPIYIKDFCVITCQNDGRTFDEIVLDINKKNLLTDIQFAENTKQVEFKDTKKLRWQRVPTFLGVNGNVNIWEAGFRGFLTEEKQHYELYDYFVPRQNWTKMNFNKDVQNVIYRYALGRGMGAKNLINRRNYKGIYPSLIANIMDNDVCYKMQCFCDTKMSKPEEEPGTHYLNADLHSAVYVLNEKQKKIALEKEDAPDTILRVKISITNTSNSSRVAYLRLPEINVPVMAEINTIKQKIKDGKGFLENSVYMNCEINDEKCEGAEHAFVLSPEGKITVNIILFHKPVSEEEAEKYITADFDKRLKLYKKIWDKKAGSLLKWHLPEKRIDEAFKTGYFHLLQCCYGENDSDTVAPTAGVYPPIGSESSPIIQLLDSVGNGKLAGYGINYFFDKCDENGFIQNIQNYMLENGATLYNAGIHYLYTHDEAWLKRNKNSIIRATEYILKWIDRNKDIKVGRGMIDGQVADPEDTYRSYALNAFAYAGLNMAVYLYDNLDICSKNLNEYALKLKEDIKAAFRKALETSPVVPLKNGTWVPAVGPWAEARGAISLHLEDNASAFTHASHVLKDSLLSLHYLVHYGVFEYNSEEAELIINYLTDLYSEDCVALSQPYYNLIPFINLKRGEKNAFLKEYYTTFSTMSDHETYSFWEHFFLATPHKTHEQAWFLMRTRNMLYFEDENKLVLLKGVPDKWMVENKNIHIENAHCLFGVFSMDVKYTKSGCIIEIDCDFNAKIKIFGKNNRIIESNIVKGKNTYTL